MNSPAPVRDAFLLNFGFAGGKLVLSTAAFDARRRLLPDVARVSRRVIGRVLGKRGVFLTIFWDVQKERRKEKRRMLMHEKVSSL